MKVSFIGGGNMGEAIIAALITRKLAPPGDIFVADASVERQEYLKQKYAVFTTGNNLEAAAMGETIILAVKPQQLDEVTRELRGHIHSNQLVLSIIAGKTLAALRQGLEHTAIVRAMPNTPAQIGRGMTVWTATDSASETHRTTAETILGVMGCAAYTSTEGVLDMATAVSGSGPAYVFLFIEAFIQAGQNIGLTPELARLLAFETMLGATEYARRSGLDLATLRRNVTSPGGTTAAALKVLEGDGLSDLMERAVATAYRRAQELGT